MERTPTTRTAITDRIPLLPGCETTKKCRTANLIYLWTQAFDGQSVIDSQFRALSESQNLLWDQFEPEVINAVEQVTEQQRTLIAHLTD